MSAPDRDSVPGSAVPPAAPGHGSASGHGSGSGGGADQGPAGSVGHGSATHHTSPARRIWRLIVGKPRDLADRSLARHLALVPLLAWIGLGADGLSSSSYGPEEAFKAIGEHTYLAVMLALATAGTVILLSRAYRALIETFPTGGGYVVATRMLGGRAGVVAGGALLVDYVLTITISIAAAGEAMFSLLPVGWAMWKLPCETAVIIALTALNLRGVRESVIALVPIFLLFLITHALLIVLGVVRHLPEVGETASSLGTSFAAGLSALGVAGMLLLFLNAYSLGGGTYTGIEAVSNAVPIMREPRVANAQRTMSYLAISLAVAAGGLILCYLLWQVRPTAGRTMNAVLAERVSAGLPGAATYVWATMLSASALLIAAAQAGFIGGPRVMANLAVDSWLPRRFAALSERLTTGNGVLFMGGMSLAALWYTGGHVEVIVVMYSINVFLTFLLSMAGMTRYWQRQPAETANRRQRIALFAGCQLLCATILAVTIAEKFTIGGWVTLLITSALVAVCMLVRAHYRAVAMRLRQLYAQLHDLPRADAATSAAVPAVDPARTIAAVLVSSYGGVSIHTLLGALRAFPGHFSGVVFISVGVLDSDRFSGDNAVEDLRRECQDHLDRFVALAHAMGLPATARLRLGTDPVEEAELVCLDVIKEFPRAVFVAGKVIFRTERWYHHLLHNDLAIALQRRLQWAGRTMVIIPARLER